MGHILLGGSKHDNNAYIYMCVVFLEGFVL